MAGGGSLFASNGDGGPQTPATEPREEWGKGGGKHGNSGSTEEVRAGAAAGEFDTSRGHQRGRSRPGHKRKGGGGGLEACCASICVHTHADLECSSTRMWIKTLMATALNVV